MHVWRCPEEQVAFARGMLSYLAMTQPEGGSNTMCSRWSTLTTPSLMKCWQARRPYLRAVIHFNDSLSACGLRYVGDALPPSTETGESVEQIHQLHALVSSGQTSMPRSNIFDFAVNRRERVSLLSPVMMPSTRRR